MSSAVVQSPLGKKTTYLSQYKRDLLFPIARKLKRVEINVPEVLPFKGVDIWNAYELSWLNDKGKPMVAVGEFIFPCESPNIVESKSLKLYLNSFNNTKFSSIAAVSETIQRDLSEAAGAIVIVKISPHVILSTQKEKSALSVTENNAVCLDQLDVACDTYSVNPSFLQIENDNIVAEVLYSDLLKSNCLVTGQPDWGSIQIHYVGKTIKHEGMLKYIVSFRNHNEFHEQCVERIFMDVMQYCQPQHLTVRAYYARRGGLDINPLRSTETHFSKDHDQFSRS